MNSQEMVDLHKKWLKNLINVQVANLSVLYQKLHHFHWFAKGSNFFTLHEKFQVEYEEVTELVDEVAERLIQIGGTPASSLHDYLTMASLKENQKEAGTSEQMLETLVADYKQLIEGWRAVIEGASKANDKVTEDLFIGMCATFEKKIWLYEAFLGK